jgi:hypothetical protein
VSPTPSRSAAARAASYRGEPAQLAGGLADGVGTGHVAVVAGPVEAEVDEHRVAVLDLAA